MLTFQLLGAALLALFFGPMLSSARSQHRYTQPRVPAQAGMQGVNIVARRS